MGENSIICIPDSNVFIGTGRYFLAGDMFGSLALKFRRNNVRFLVPEFVVREVVSHYQRKFREAIEKSQNALKEYSDPSDRILNLKDLLGHRVEEYEVILRKRLSDVGAIVIPIPQLDVMPFIERALVEHLPFTRSEKSLTGFKDAVLWECVKHISHTEHGSMINFITNDNDFCGKDDRTRLHPPLQAEIREGDIAIVLVKDLKTFIEGLKESAVSLEPVEVEEPLRTQLADLLQHAFSSDDPMIAAQLGVDRIISFAVVDPIPSMTTIAEEKLEGGMISKTYAVSLTVHLHVQVSPDAFSELVGGIGQGRSGNRLGMLRTLDVQFEAIFNSPDAPPSRIEIRHMDTIIGTVENLDA